MGFIEWNGVRIGRHMQLHDDKAKASGLDNDNRMILDPSPASSFLAARQPKLEDPDRLQKRECDPSQ